MAAKRKKALVRRQPRTKIEVMGATIFRYDAFIAALLAYIKHRTGGIVSMRKLLATGVELYARHRVNFDNDDFKAFLEKEVLPKLDDDQAREAVRYRAESFLQDGGPAPTFNSTNLRNFLDM